MRQCNFIDLITLCFVLSLTSLSLQGLDLPSIDQETPPNVEPRTDAAASVPLVMEDRNESASETVRALTAPVRVDENREITFVVSGIPQSGFLVHPATDSEFKFRLAETGDVVEFRWSMLEEPERKRIMKLYGINVNDGRLQFGRDMRCIRLYLKSKKSYEGLEMPDRALPGYICLKTATQVVQIPERDIESKEEILKYESDLFSAKEIYERMILEKPPGMNNAADHLQFARDCSNMGLYDLAIDHLEMAKTIDPRTEERVAEFRLELVQKHREQMAEKLYLEIVRDLNGGGHALALEKIERLKRNFPNSEYYTRVDSMQTDVAAKAQVDFKKQVIFLYYQYAHILIEQALNKRLRLDEKGRPIPAQPGKQVTTRQGHIFRGELIEDTVDRVLLKQGDTTVEIPAKDIMTLQDIDLSVASKTQAMTLKKLREYVTDKEGGLGRDIVNQISALLKIDEEKVKEAWDTRFNRTATYIQGQLVKSPIYTSVHEAYYGQGSWLQDGVQLQNQGTGNRNNNNNSRGSYSSRQQQRQQQQQQQSFEEFRQKNPTTTDNPDVWWEAQSSDIKLGILRAVAADNLFRVKQRVGINCPTCGAKGVIEVWGGGAVRYDRCPTCRGMKLLTKVLYE